MYSKNKYSVEKATIREAQAIAFLHKNEISEGFLSSLNIKVLVSFYRFLIQNEIVYIIKGEDAKVAGFISCCIDLKKLYIRFILKRGLFVFIYLIPIFFSKSLLIKIKETLLVPFKYKNKDMVNKKCEKDNLFEHLPELLSISVLKEYHRAGLGSILLESLEKKLKVDQYKGLRVVVGGTLDAARGFYERNGFTIYKRGEIHKGSISYFLIKTF